MSWNLLWSLCWKLIIRLLSVCICAIIFVKVARNLMHLWRTLRGLRLGPFCGTYELRQSLISRMMYHAAWRRSRQFSLLVGLYTSKYSDRTMYRCTVLPDQLTHVLLQNVSGMQLCHPALCEDKIILCYWLEYISCWSIGVRSTAVGHSSHNLHHSVTYYVEFSLYAMLFAGLT